MSTRHLTDVKALSPAPMGRTWISTENVPITLDSTTGTLLTRDITTPPFRLRTGTG
ncbi:MAG: hypothetical protein ACRELA_08790 [Candidatus Rokuibacteriota bacterium]